MEAEMTVRDSHLCTWCDNHAVPGRVTCTRHIDSVTNRRMYYMDSIRAAKRYAIRLNNNRETLKYFRGDI